MIDDVGSLRINLEVENPARPGERSDLARIAIARGLNLRIDPVGKRLVDGGPMTLAAVA